MGGTSNIYSVDSSALIHGWRRVYRPKNFGFIWDRLDGLIAEGRMCMSIEVFRELGKKDDELHDWCKARKDRLCVEIDEAIQLSVGRIMTIYPRLVDTVKGRSGADPFVIALASTMNPNMVVVSEEGPGKQRIPEVCDGENIRCIHLADLIEEEDWQFR